MYIYIKYAQLVYTVRMQRVRYSASQYAFQATPKSEPFIGPKISNSAVPIINIGLYGMQLFAKFGMLAREFPRLTRCSRAFVILRSSAGMFARSGSG